MTPYGIPYGVIAVMEALTWGLGQGGQWKWPQFPNIAGAPLEGKGGEKLAGMSREKEADPLFLFSHSGSDKKSGDLLINFLIWSSKAEMYLVTDIPKAP